MTMTSMAHMASFTLNPREDDNGGGKTWDYEAAQLMRSLKRVSLDKFI